MDSVGDDSRTRTLHAGVAFFRRTLERKGKPFNVPTRQWPRPAVTLPAARSQRSGQKPPSGNKAPILVSILVMTLSEQDRKHLKAAEGGSGQSP
jgi:hypothetical protein